MQEDPLLHKLSSAHKNFKMKKTGRKKLISGRKKKKNGKTKMHTAMQMTVGYRANQSYQMNLRPNP